MKKSKKVLSFILSSMILVISVCVGFTVSVNAIDVPTVLIESKTVAPSESFVVSVNIENSAEVFHGNFTLSYDSNLLEVKEYSYGNILANHNKSCNLNYQSKGNLIRLSFNGTDALTGDGALLTLSFSAKTDVTGDAVFNFTACNMYDENSGSLGATAIGGTISIVGITTTSVTTSATNPKETTVPPVTSTTTDPKETTTAPPVTTTEPPVTVTEPPVTTTDPKEPVTTIGYENMVLMGDADLDESVNIKDATLIQKNVAGLTEISDMATFAANVIATDTLNIKDATAIQKWVASLTVDVTINEYVPYYGDTQIPSEPEVVTTTAEPVETTTEEQIDNVVVISCGGETYTAKVGDTVTYSVLLSADEKFENIEGNIRYDSVVLSPVMEDETVICPNLTDSVVNQEINNCVYFIASDGYTGFDFKSEKILVTYSFVVLSTENTEIEFDIDTMTIFGGENYYFDEGKAIVTDGITIKETVVVS